MFAFALFLDSNVESGEKDKITIKVVMKKAMTGGLCKKVASGKASDDEKKELVSLFEAMAKIDCPKGDAASWKAKTKALVDAAKAGDGDALKKAADCAGCHSEHKGGKKK